ncbi:MAG TPA: nucleotidyltransferase domain-containing protein [Thermoanaerobaculia bacterium]|nr:nucleotidyltransferase domain-containing protein [Thermoanaerobaculia bacterium]
MHTEIETRLPQLRDLCGKHFVTRLDLFGSGTGDEFEPARSDLDFLVEFQPMPPARHAKAFFGLLADLESLFGRRVDLLEREAIENPYLWTSIEKSRHAVYVAEKPAAHELTGVVAELAGLLADQEVDSSKDGFAEYLTRKYS